VGYFRTQLREFRAVGVFLAALIAVLALQFVHGAYSAPIDGYPDEPAHVVTTLMYRQFVLAPTADPLQFAKNYYSHYPFLAAGHWPPMLHLSAAVWTILLGVGKTQLLLYLALAGGLAGALLYRSIAAIGSAWLAAAFVGIWMMLAQSQAAFSNFMTEGPLALLTLAAVVVYIRYLRNPNYRLALLFAALSSAAILTKETAVALAFAPLLTVAATRQWPLLRKGHFWLPAALVPAIVAPWHLWIAGLGVGRFRGGVVQRLTIYTDSSLSDRLALFVELLGWPLLLLVTVGLVARLASIKKGRDASTIWIAHASLLTGGLAVLFVAPESNEVRHLYQLSPSLLLFAAAGAGAVTQRFQGSLRTPAAVLVGLACILLSPANFALGAKASVAPDDSSAVAQYLCSQPDAQTILISTNGSTLEGPLIAELALREPLPTRYLVRSSNTIYRSGWNRTYYHTIISDLPDLEKFIDSSGVDTIVRLTGRTQPHRPDEALLSLVIAGRPNDWASVPIDFPADAKVYRRTTVNKTIRQPIRIQMASKLGEDLLVEPAAAPVPAEQRP